MTILITLGPLLFSLLLGYWLNIKLLSDKFINSALSWLTYLILGMVGASIGMLDSLVEKLTTAGSQALVFFSLFSIFSILALCVSGHYFRTKQTASSEPETQEKLSLRIFSDAFKTLVAVILGVIIGVFYQDGLNHLDAVITYLLYVLLLLIGCQLQRSNYRLRKLFLNIQGLIIAFTVLVTTLASGALGAYFLGLPITDGLAVVSGFGWYSLSGILITGLGNPVLGTTAFLIDIGREILALLLIPIFCRLNNHVSVGYSGATAMDFTLPMLAKSHGPEIIPTAIASGLILSLLTPILIPLFMEI